MWLVCLPVWAQDGAARIKSEIERLRQSYPQKFEPANIKDATDDLLKAASSALNGGNLYLSLEKLGQAADYLQARAPRWRRAMRSKLSGLPPAARSKHLAVRCAR